MNCPACNYDEVLVMTDGLSECKYCGHIWESELKVTKSYDRQYMKERYDVYPTTEAMSFLRLGLIKSLTSSGLLLDVGYGNGSFVRLAEKAGFEAYGNDVHGVDYGVKEVELTDDRYWDVITFFDSLEHFSDLSKIKPLCRRADYVVVSFPTRPNSFPENKDWKHYRPGEHLHYFCRKSLWHTVAGKRVGGLKVFATTILEDVIRGGGKDGQSNITTVVFG
jgi:hypothetical protein